MIIKLSTAEYQELSEDNAGVCIACGEIWFGGIEPDARKYKCNSCSAHAVYGISEALLNGSIRITDEDLRSKR
jgi:hypothetical protein